MNPAYFVEEKREDENWFFWGKERDKESWKFCWGRDLSLSLSGELKWMLRLKCNCEKLGIEIFNWKLTYLNPSNVTNTLKIWQTYRKRHNKNGVTLYQTRVECQTNYFIYCHINSTILCINCFIGNLSKYDDFIREQC